MTGLTPSERAYIEKRNRKIIELYRAGYWLSNIGERFGLHEEAVRMILRNAGVVNRFCHA